MFCKSKVIREGHVPVCEVNKTKTELVFGIFISFFLLFCIGCQARTETQEQELEKTTNTKGLGENYIGVSELMQYIQNSENLTNNSELYEPISSVEIKKFHIEEDIVYLAAITPSTGWETLLFNITVGDDGEISEIDNTGIGGNKYLFDYELVELNNVFYVAVVSASHSGNGDLQFFPVSKFGVDEMAFSLPNIVDVYHEESEETAVEYGLFSGYGGGVKGSLVYPQNKLNAEYIDTNGDGKTEIVLTGIQQFIICEDGSADYVAKTFVVERVYRYDEKTDSLAEISNELQEIVPLKK